MENTLETAVPLHNAIIEEVLSVDTIDHISLSGDGDFKAVIVGDIHSMGQNPVSRKDFFPDTLVLKLNEIMELSNEIASDAMFFLGDFFNSPESANSTIAKFGPILLKAKCRKIGVLGNHDIYGGNEDTYDRCAIGLLEAFNCFRIIKKGEKIIFHKGNNVIQLTGQSYHYNIDKLTPEQDYCVDKAEGVTKAIHLAHGYLVPRPLNFKHTLISEIENKTEADITFTGHYHKPHVYNSPNGKLFANPGAVSRITCSVSELRQPQVFILTIKETGEVILEPYELKTAPPSSAVIERDSLEQEDSKFYQINAFVSSIQNVVTTRVLDPMAIVDQISEELELDAQVKADVLNAISNAQSELDSLSQEWEVTQ